MRQKKAKELRRLARRMAEIKTPGRIDKIYDRLKSTYKTSKDKK